MTEYTQDQLDMVAEQMFDFACANRTDNLNRDGSPGDPRKVCCKYQDLWDSPKTFYRNLATWHLSQRD
jgi:hypothetical protein